MITYNICLNGEIRKIFSCYTLLSGAMKMHFLLLSLEFKLSRWIAAAIFTQNNWTSRPSCSKLNKLLANMMLKFPFFFIFELN